MPFPTGKSYAMAKQTSEQRDANLAACVVMLCQMTYRQLQGNPLTPEELANQLIAIQEIAFTAVTGRLESYWQQACKAIEEFRMPESTEQNNPVIANEQQETPIQNENLESEQTTEAFSF